MLVSEDTCKETNIHDGKITHASHHHRCGGGHVGYNHCWPVAARWLAQYWHGGCAGELGAGGQQGRRYSSQFYLAHAEWAEGQFERLSRQGRAAQLLAHRLRQLPGRDARSTEGIWRTTGCAEG